MSGYYPEHHIPGDDTCGHPTSEAGSQPMKGKFSSYWRTLLAPVIVALASTRLRERYVDTGKVRFATRDLPLPFHAFALPAAVAARCAGQQGKFWEYREALFLDQSLLGQDRYAELAGRLGLDTARFEACRVDPTVAQAVRADATLAASSGIASTPSFVIGRVVNGEFEGEVIAGAQSFEVFQQRLDSLLQQTQE